MFQTSAMTWIAQLTLAIGLLVVPTAAAKPENTKVATFILQFDPNDLPDLDSDGVPDLPDLQDDEYKLIYFEEQQNYADTITFAATPPTCGGFDVAGMQMVTDSTAFVIHRGRPYSVSVYREAYGIPAYRSTVLTKHILDSETCWAAEVPFYGQVRLQAEFDEETTRCLAFVTVRIAL